jgi:leucyl/phenylalanyl-tRNA---protein transferase
MSDVVFPPTSQALTEPNGLLARGGDLSVATLLTAYRRGIFPWFEEPGPIYWWSPNPRAVVFPEEFRLSRSLRKQLRRESWRLALDTAFAAVVQACAASRSGQPGTWIGPRILAAYVDLQRAGYAHSIEVFADSELVGGLYGVAVGRVFFGESMFHRRSNASKVAFAALMQILRHGAYAFADCQVESAHLSTLGARSLSRMDFERLLADNVDLNPLGDPWRLPECAGALL